MVHGPMLFDILVSGVMAKRPVPGDVDSRAMSTASDGKPGSRRQDSRPAHDGSALYAACHLLVKPEP